MFPECSWRRVSPLGAHQSSNCGICTQHTPPHGTFAPISFNFGSLSLQALAFSVDFGHVGQVNHEGTSDAGEEPAIEAFVESEPMHHYSTLTVTTRYSILSAMTQLSSQVRGYLQRVPL